MEVGTDFPSFISLGRLAFHSVRSNLNFPHPAYSYSALTLALSLFSISCSGKKYLVIMLMSPSPYSLKPGLLADGIAKTSKMVNAFNTGNYASNRLSMFVVKDTTYFLRSLSISTK